MSRSFGIFFTCNFILKWWLVACYFHDSYLAHAVKVHNFYSTFIFYLFSRYPLINLILSIHVCLIASHFIYPSAFCRTFFVIFSSLLLLYYSTFCFICAILPFIVLYCMYRYLLWMMLTKGLYYQVYLFGSSNHRDVLCSIPNRGLITCISTWGCHLLMQ